jgi:general secretion pathway protein I
VNSKWSKHAEGFTLLEVMVALAIIAFTVVTYVHSQNTSIALLTESTNVTVATLLAQGRMILLEGDDISGPVEREGTFEEARYAQFRWKEHVVATPLPNILEAHVEVSWDDNRGLRSVELISMVVRK